jgi:RHS repeat-associated protein
MGIDIHLVYDSSYSAGTSPVTEMGWRVVPATAAPGTVVAHQDSSEFNPLPCQPGITSCNAGFTNSTYSFAFIDSTGYAHGGIVASSVECRGGSPEPCTNVNLSGDGFAADGSGYIFTVNPTIPSPTPASVIVAAPSGNAYSLSSVGAPTTMTDSNGNNGSGVSSPAFWVNWSQTLTDDSNVSATITGGAYSSSDSTQWTSRAPLQVQYHDTLGNLQTTTVNYSLHNVNINCTSIGGSNFTAIIGMADSVVYPDGSNYQFTYQVDGQLASMQLPTGGVISYSTSSLCATGASGSIGIPATVSRTTSDGVTTYNQTATPCGSPGCSYPLTSITNVSNPDGSSEKVNFVYTQPWAGSAVPPVSNNYETAHTWTSSSGTLLKSTMRCYNGATGDCTTTPLALPITQIAATTTVGGLTSKTIEFMNAAGLVTENDEYDFGASSPSRKTVTAYAPLGNNIASRPSSVTVFDGSGNVAQQTTYGYDETSLLPTTELPGHAAISGARGNQTSMHQWLNTTNTTFDTHDSYDDAGQVVSSQDARQNSTQFVYDAATDSCLSRTTLPTVSGQSAMSSSSVCDPNTGLTMSTTDLNGKTTSYGYDAMLRSTITNYPDGGSKTKSYSGAALPETITTNVAATPNPTEISSITLDGYGRVSRTIGSNSATTDSTYDSSGRLYTVSNPYFTKSDPTYGVTTYLYDGLGRMVLQTHPDGFTQQWSYSGSTTTFTDEASHSWSRTTDALGRLTNVVEPTGVSTGYVYDALNNLRTVNQNGGSSETPRTRSFVYDSLSRLTSATNPETGAIGYGYDANGNMTSKTDARGIATSYVYDALNRMTSKSSSGGSGVPGFNYGYLYDVSGSTFTSSNPIGRMTEASNSVNASEQFSYDTMGRITSQWNTLPDACCSGTANPISVVYDLAGHVSSLTYPDGLTLNQTWDSGGRVTQITNPATGYQYLTQATYLPNGAPQVISYGNGVENGYDLNNRMQLIQSGKVRFASGTNGSYSAQYLLSNKEICYGPSTAALSSTIPGCTSNGMPNNGNIWQVMDVLNGAATQSFSYDNLNRLTFFQQTQQLASEGAEPQQSYSYDSFGNLTQINSPVQLAGLTYGTNNQINNLPCAQSVTSFDAAGNQLCDTDANGLVRQYQLDAEGKISQITAINTSTPFETYIYDANGDRVRKTDGGGTFTEYVRFNNQVLAEKNSDGTWSDYIFANGQRIARADDYDIRIHMSGTNCSGCSNPNMFAGILSLNNANTYTIRQGDVLSWRQYQDGSALGGLIITFLNNGINSNASGTLDSDGEPINADTTMNSWHMRTVDLSAFVGQTVSGVDPFDWQTAPAGNWDIYYGDITLSSTDGTVIPLYNRAIMGFTTSAAPGVSNFNAVTEKVGSTPNQFDTTYYSGDQTGSTRMLTDGAGWPVSSSIYYPFGQEASTLTDNNPNRYKFTGKERDTESGLDYFGARYYGSSMGRFMSPDDGSDQDITNPQSLNLYSYVQNNPLTNTDPDGHTCQTNSSDGNVYDDGDGQGCATVDQQNADDLANGRYSATVTANWGSIGTLSSSVGNLAQQAGNAFSNAAQQVSSYLTAPRDPGCMNAYAGAGAIAGAGIGAYNGAVLGAGGGAVVGFAGGGVGAIPGGIGGGIAGGAAGGVVGGYAGGVGGAAIGYFACASGGGGSGGGGGGSAQAKKLTPGEIAKLKQNGIDPEMLKEETGTTQSSKSDLYKLPNGDIIVKGKGGIGPGEPTGININRL